MFHRALLLIALAAFSFGADAAQAQTRQADTSSNAASRVSVLLDATASSARFTSRVSWQRTNSARAGTRLLVLPTEPVTRDAPSRRSMWPYLVIGAGVGTLVGAVWIGKEASHGYPGNEAALSPGSSRVLGGTVGFFVGTLGGALVYALSSQSP